MKPKLKLPTHLEEEWTYRYLERLGMMLGIRLPEPHHIKLATREANLWAIEQLENEENG